MVSGGRRNEEREGERGGDGRERSGDDFPPGSRAVELKRVSNLGSDEVEEGFGGEAAVARRRGDR
jgi:hypothetical protein